MIDKICNFIIIQMKKKMDDIDEEREEVIKYGLSIIIGEFPKILVVLSIAYFLGIFKLTLITFLLIIPYRGSSGGCHMHTHTGCIILTSFLYIVPAFVSRYLIITGIEKYILIVIEWSISMLIIKKYVPADTEDVPILESKVRRKKQLVSYILLSIGMIISLILKNEISTILIIGNLLQTLSLTKVAYKLTNSKYGYEVYGLT